MKIAAKITSSGLAKYLSLPFFLACVSGTNSFFSSFSFLLGFSSFLLSYLDKGKFAKINGELASDISEIDQAKLIKLCLIHVSRLWLLDEIVKYFLRFFFTRKPWHFVHWSDCGFHCEPHNVHDPASGKKKMKFINNDMAEKSKQ